MTYNNLDQEEYPYFLDYSYLFRMKLIKEFLGDVDGKTVADVGCGNGSTSFLISSVGAEVHSIDISKKMLQATRNQKNNQGSAKFNPNLYLGDATRLPIKSEAFDVVCCLETLEHVEDDGAAVEELARVTKLGGRIIIAIPFNAGITGKEKSRGRYRRYSLQTVDTRLRSGQLKVEGFSFWCFPISQLLDKIKLRFFGAAIGNLLEALSANDTPEHKPLSLLSRNGFTRSLTRFYSTSFWGKAALPTLLRLEKLNMFFENKPYSNDVFLILKKVD
jgi:ubiquinone/menaquinone biosynthesis C-methylase UbiE